MSELKPVAVGIDIGGTKMVACTIDANGTVLDRTRRESPAFDPDGIVKAAAEVAKDLGPGLPIGLGLAGAVDSEGRFVYGPNFLREPHDFAGRLREETGSSVVAGNDATVALVAEARIGAAAGKSNVVMFTIGTGVGGGLIVEGNLVYGHGGFAAELGHVMLNYVGRTGDTVQGTVENYCSGPAIAREAQRRIDAGDTTSLADVDDLTGKAVTLAAIDGDAVAIEVLSEAGDNLGRGMGSVVNVLDPEVIVLGGGATTLAAPWLVPAATETLAQVMMGHPHRPTPPIVVAALGDDAGMIGAALLAADGAQAA